MDAQNQTFLSHRVILYQERHLALEHSKVLSELNSNTLKSHLQTYLITLYIFLLEESIQSRNNYPTEVVMLEDLFLRIFKKLYGWVTKYSLCIQDHFVRILSPKCRCRSFVWSWIFHHRCRSVALVLFLFHLRV